MGWQENMYEAIAEFLRTSKGLDAVKVTDFYDHTQWSGGCETCGYDEIVCDISYVNSKGKSRLYTYSGGFSSLVSAL